MIISFFKSLGKRSLLRQLLKIILPSGIRYHFWLLVNPVEKYKLVDPQKIDEHLLNMIITHRGHRLDKATKGEWNQKKLSGAMQYKTQLESALETCRLNKREGDHISWAQRILVRYQQMERNKKSSFESFTNNNTRHMDNIYDVIRNRRSIRYFKNQIIEKEKIEQILDAGRWAPCSGNRQAWRFIVERIGKVHDIKNTNDKPIDFDYQSLPHGVVVLYVAMDERMYPWKYAAAMDAAAAIQNMLLMAHYIGVGACWYYGAERLNQTKMRARLGLPEYYFIYSTVQLGYPAETPEAPGRMPLDTVATFI